MKINSPLHALAGILGIFAATVSPASAAILTVNPGDIVSENTYGFEILSGAADTTTFSHLGNYSESGNGVAMVSNSNFWWFNEGNTNFLRTGDGGPNASIVLGWDFSGSGYAPTSVSILQQTVAVTSGQMWTLSTSTDGVNFTPYASYDTTNFNNPPVSVSVSGTPSQFYIKAEVANGGWINSQWGRSDVSPTVQESFGATFTVTAVPEPTSAGLILAAFSVGVIFLRRRPRVSHTS